MCKLSSADTGNSVVLKLRYGTRCYFNVRSKDDISQLNLPHGTKNCKSGKIKKKQIWSDVLVNSPGRPRSQSWRRKTRLRREGFAEKREILSLEWKIEGVMDDESSESMEPTEGVPLVGLGESECVVVFLQCCDAVGWAAGRASSL